MDSVGSLLALQEGRDMLRQHNSCRAGKAGFTLLEVLVVITVFGIMMVFAVPNLKDWIARTSVRSGVEDARNAMQLAQAEAAKRNGLVEFSLLSSRPAPATGNVFNTAGTANGSFWVVRVVPAEKGKDKAYVQGGDFGSRALDISGDANIVFNGLGQALSEASTWLAASKVYRIKSKSTQYAMCVFVRPGGAVRWCDPRMSGTPAACPADIRCSGA